MRHSEAWGGLRAQELVQQDGIYHRTGQSESSDYRNRWENEAAEDHVRSAIAAGPTTELDYATLTGKIAPVWDRIPRGTRPRHRTRGRRRLRAHPALPCAGARRHVDGLLRSRHLRDDAARGFVEYRDRFAPGESPLYLVCASADELPLEDESVDTVLTSVVFLHMGKSFVGRAVAEIARMLRPGGRIVFDASFPNARNPANLLLQAKPKRLRSPNYMKFWTRDAVERLLESSGLTAKTGPLEIAAGGHRARAAPPRPGAGARRAPGQSARRAPPREPARDHGDDLPRLQPRTRPMRALVTGGGGFLGTRLVERLGADGHDVFAARRRDYDLTTMEAAARLFEDARPELVFHLAAEVGGIGANRANPGRYWYANLMMGAHVLEQSRLHEVEKLVIAGTVCSYPKFTPVPFSEDELWNGFPEETNAPYGVAKKAVLIGAQAYRDQYGLRAAYLMPANLYGPGDNFHETNAHVIPDLIRKMLEGRDEIVLWGDGTPTREFLYVDDCVDGLALAAERYDGREPVNLGTGDEISIRDLAELVADVTGFEGRITWDSTMPNGQPRRGLDASRARELFGWQATTTLRDGLERTVAWYRSRRTAHAGA